MAHSSKALNQFKRNWQTFQSEQIQAACREAGMTWRERLLDPRRTVQLFLLQVAHGNTACSHLRHLSKMSFSAAAYCRARSRIPLAVFERLLKNFNNSRTVNQPEQLWYGHRTYIVDGSNFTMPDTKELKRHFGQPSGQQNCGGFPAAHFLALFDHGTGLIKQVLPGPLFTHDIARAHQLHPELSGGDILLGDRGFCSFAHLALMARSGIGAVLRLHQSRAVKVKEKRFRAHKTARLVRQLGRNDQLVAWRKPAKCPPWMSVRDYERLPRELIVRQLRYSVSLRGFRSANVGLVTTLLCPQRYPLAAVALLYGDRWQIETNLRHLKTTMGMEQLHCKTVQGVLKELLAFCLIYNLVRSGMLHAAKAQGLPVQRISFVDALRWLVSGAETGAVLLLINPKRPNRFEPRAIKRRPKSFRLLTVSRRMAKANEIERLAA